MMRHRALVAILCVAALLRLAAIGPVHSAGFTSDEKEYFSMARGILDRGEFIDSNGDRAVRAPLYPGFVAALLYAGGGSWTPVFVLGCLLGTMAVWLTYRLSIRLGVGETASLVAAGIVAVYPGMIVYSALAQTEVLYTCFFLLALLFFENLLDTPEGGIGIARGISLGIVAGLAALTRVVFAGFLPVLLALLLWRRRGDIRRVAVPAVLAGLCALLTILPWTLRNTRLFGELVPITSGGGSSFLTGNNPYATGTYRTREGFDQYFSAEAREKGVDAGALNEVERSRVAGKIGREYVLDHPGEALGLAVKKSYIFWVYPITHSDSYLPLQAAAVGVDGLLALLCVAGGVALWPERRKFIVPALAFLFFWGVQAVLHSEARFRLPLIPLTAVIAGVGITTLIQDYTRGTLLAVRGSRIALGVGWGLVVLVYGATGVLHVLGKF
jgi:4-amino-4-deoxy-L-arabinose transferase-like glycosyltransferase